MKRCFLIIAAYAFLVMPIAAQNRRSQNLPPQLLENPDSHIASGLAQSPSGYPISISVEPLPRGSIIGLYGNLLRRNNVVSAVIVTGAGEHVLDVEVHPMSFPKLEMMTFRMPGEITGEVWVRITGLHESNSVRFFIY